MQRIKKLFVGMALFALIVQLVVGPFAMQVSAADSKNFAVYVGATPGEQRQVLSAWNDSGGTNYGNAGWSVIEIRARDFAGIGPATLRYNSSASREMACGFGEGSTGQCDDREPLYTIKYYCSISDRKLQFERPGNESSGYYEIEFAIGLQNTNGGGGDQFVGRDGFNAVGGPLHIRKYAGQDNGTTTRDLTRHVFGPDDLDDSRPQKTNIGLDVGGIAGNQNGREDDDFGIDEQRPNCIPPSSILGQMEGPQGQIRNFNKLDATEKLIFSNAAEQGIDASSQQENIDSLCQKAPGFFSGGISWVVCPLINMGTNATDTLFKDLIAPLLEDVPVSTKSDSGTFKAWQSFRTIGNIALIGTLMAVVYAQVKGDR